MPETIIIVLLVLWLLGLMTGTPGSYLLLVVALGIFVIRFVTSRKAE